MIILIEDNDMEGVKTMELSLYLVKGISGPSIKLKGEINRILIVSLIDSDEESGWMRGQQGRRERSFFRGGHVCFE